mgnify:FL=1
MGLMDTIRSKLLNWLLPDEYMTPGVKERLEDYSIRQQYYQGNYRKQLAVKALQADDNIGSNFVGLVVDRSVSMLLGDGIELDFGENEAAEDYLDTVYMANKSDILFNKACQYAAIYGTGYLKIIPNGATTRGSNGIVVPRLVALDPFWLTVDTLPDDIETVTQYTIRYNTGDVAKRQRIERQVFNWLITDEQTNRMGRWEIVNQQEWPYEFPPIVHWQNLPQPSDVYGQSDIKDVIELQDRANFIASNIRKIIRLFLKN